MNRDNQKLTDIMMGEALLALLKNGSAVSATGLIKKLQALAASEKDETRRQACKRAIMEVRNSLAAPPGSHSRQGRDAENRQHLFARDEPSKTRNKH